MSVLNSWIHRGLTLMGKVLVINTLMGSLFVYKMTVLRNIDKAISTKFYETIHRFLWKGRARIPFQILHSDKEQGGLCLVNLICKQEALKVQ